MPIVAIGLSHRSAPVDVREKFAFKETEIPEVLNDLRTRGLISEGVILSTCNRVELYAVTQSADPTSLAELRAHLSQVRRCDGAFHNHFYHHGEPSSLEHLFKVACGLDSMVLGETEILGQLKKAYDLGFSTQIHRWPPEQSVSARVQCRQAHPHRQPIFSAAVFPSVPWRWNSPKRFSARSMIGT